MAQVMPGAIANRTQGDGRKNGLIKVQVETLWLGKEL